MRPIGWILLAIIFALIGAGYFLFTIIQKRAATPFERSSVVEQQSISNNQSSMPLTITSPVFETNGLIPARFTCDDKNISPELIFGDIPPQTQSLALTMEDPDVPTSIRPDGMWNHWIVWNISPSTVRIEENATSPGILGLNTSGKSAYAGPCPPDFPLVSPETLGNRNALDSSRPPDREHRYIFTLYALDTLISLPQGATKEALLTAISTHVIEQAKLIGRYKRI